MVSLAEAPCLGDAITGRAKNRLDFQAGLICFTRLDWPELLPSCQRQGAPWGYVPLTARPCCLRFQVTQAPKQCLFASLLFFSL